jgi:hypothetical protein
MENARHRRCRWIVALLLLALGPIAVAATPRDTLTVDLRPLIDSAAQYPTRFAVDIAHPASSQTHGVWTRTGNKAVWTYGVRIPTAVSMSFHASSTVLPSSATLVVRAGTVTYRYTSRDVHRGQLWSRIAIGDTLTFELTVAVSDRDSVVLDIASLQAGYRGLNNRVPDHPYYRALRNRLASTGAADPNASCVVNYACAVTPANTAQGGATAALLIANVGQCTGTLLNDVPGDATPYLLTARHCETGKLGGGAPGAAAAVSVYWDAVTPCGGALGTIYDPGIPYQVGASTVVEQQDAWLISLDDSPVVSDAYFSGFDASGGSVQGGYTVHHALSYNKQYTAWFGQAAAVQQASVPGTSYTSNFWEVVNQQGNVGPGASGSGLFDQNNRLVGSLSLGRTPADGGAYGSCPVNPPPAPNGSNGVADFTALASVWNSTADSTSSTGSVTLQHVLDPQATGTMTIDFAEPLPALSLTTANATATVGGPVYVIWNAPNATSCAATGGTAGDGWTSSGLPGQASKPVTELNTGTVSYGMRCTYAGGRSTTASVQIVWAAAPLVVTLGNADEQLWVDTPWQVSWSTNAPAPCSLIGGSADFTNLPTSGRVVVSEASVGTYHYVMSCGSGTRTASTSVDMQFVTPSVTFVPSNTDLLFGQTFELDWGSLANSCTPTGGAPNDGWAGSQLYPISNAFPNITALGTYTYVITCTVGTVSAQAQATVTVENNAPYATLSASTTKFAVGQSFILTWKSNLSICIQTTTPEVGPDTLAAGVIVGSLSDGNVTYTAKVPGTWTLNMHCGNGAPPEATAAPVTVTAVPALDSSVTINPAAVQTGQTFQLMWLANAASSCTASGGGANGMQWSGPVTLGGQQNITGTTVGTFTYTLVCVGEIPSLTQTTHATIKVSASTSGGGGGGGSGGGGGGGAADWISLLSLVGLTLGRCRQYGRPGICDRDTDPDLSSFALQTIVNR